MVDESQYINDQFKIGIHSNNFVMSPSNSVFKNKPQTCPAYNPDDQKQGRSHKFKKPEITVIDLQNNLPTSRQTDSVRNNSQQAIITSFDKQYRGGQFDSGSQKTMMTSDFESIQEPNKLFSDKADDQMSKLETERIKAHSKETSHINDLTNESPNASNVKFWEQRNQPSQIKDRENVNNSMMTKRKKPKLERNANGQSSKKNSVLAMPR